MISAVAKEREKDKPKKSPHTNTRTTQKIPNNFQQPINLENLSNPNNSTKFQTHKLKKIEESTVIPISGDDAIFLRDRGLHADNGSLLAVI